MHQPLPEADHTGRLFNDGANDVQRSVARGPESLGVDHVTSEQIGHAFTVVLIVIVALLYIRHRFFQRAGAYFRPAAKKKGKKKK